PVCEELFFRGVVLQGLRRRLRTIGAVAASASLFGVMHGIGLHGLVALVLGPVSSLALLRSRTLVTSVMVHAANNLASLILWVVAPTFVLPLPFAAVGVALTAFGFLLLRARQPVAATCGAPVLS